MSAGPEKLRVIIVDDSAIYRLVLQKALLGLPNVELVCSAMNGLDALAQIGPKRADLLLLDLEMPKMNGLETLEEIRKRRLPVGVIVVSGTDMRSGSRTMSALRAGAFDFIVKPMASRGQDGASMLREPLAAAIRAFELSRRRAQARGPAPASSPRRPAAPERPREAARPTLGALAQAGRAARAQLGSRSNFDAVVLGISTGGPAALASFLPLVSGRFPVPIFVVQHMPAGFTAHLANSLDRDCELNVSEAHEGQVVRAGEVVIAPGEFHLELRGQRGEVSCHLSSAAPENSCRPAADVLFRSAAQIYGRRLLSVVMTGMGRDGLAGTKLIRAGGGYCIVQEGSSCAVNGMPRAVAEAGEADEIVPLDQMAERLQGLFQIGRRDSA